MNTDHEFVKLLNTMVMGHRVSHACIPGSIVVGGVKLVTTGVYVLALEDTIKDESLRWVLVSTAGSEVVPVHVARN